MAHTPTQPEAKIAWALMTRMLAFVHTPALPVAWPGIDMDPVPEDRKYIRTKILPNDTIRMTIDSDGPSRHFGIFQVTLVWPTGEGEVEPRDIAGALASHFPADLKMVYDGVVVRSTKRPTVAVSIPDEADLLTPVSVEYEAYI